MTSQNGQGVIGVGLAILEQDVFELREIWCSGALKWIITVADKDNVKYACVFMAYATTPANEMQIAIREWMLKLRTDEDARNRGIKTLIQMAVNINE